MTVPALRVSDLCVAATGASGTRTLLDGVSFEIDEQSVLALVGESGSGKSLTALSIMQLLPDPPLRLVRGSIELAGTSIAGLSERELCAIRGAKVAMIFQEPMTSLNPVYGIGAQIMEVLKIHRRGDAKSRKARALELLEAVGIPAPTLRFDAYPHQLSGGMRQRVMIAMALACEPALLIADEPTTALDVTVQAQILDLLRRLQEGRRMATLFITHDLGVVAELASEVAVMYAGQIVEQAPTRPLYRRPLHPYTEGLLSAIVRRGPESEPPALRGNAKRRLTTIAGAAFDPSDVLPGCRFAPRCGRRQGAPDRHPRCDVEPPELRPFEGRRWVRCHYAEEAYGEESHDAKETRSAEEARGAKEAEPADG